MVLPVDEQDPWMFRMAHSAPGRDLPDPVEVTEDSSGLTLTLPAAGQVAYDLTESGEPSPGKLVMVRHDGHRITEWLVGEGRFPAAPGSYTWTVTRGYEYGVVTGEVVVGANVSAAVRAQLTRLVDTSGFMSVDTHVHATGSPDSDVAPGLVLVHAAAHGLEIVMHTEHEFVGDYSAVPSEMGVDRWLNNINGMEMTASMPEHMTLFPLEADGSIRGGMVPWYGRDMAEILQMMRDRSDDGVSLVNHPGYMDDVGWDRVAAEPTLTDATLLGLNAGAAVWDWNFDGVEVMNGHASPFATLGNGRFDNWMSMVNAGFPMIGVGCSDDHGAGKVGTPLTWYASPTDDPAQMEDVHLVDAFLGGQVMASTGAFARVSVNDAGLGDTTTDTDGQVDLTVQVSAIPSIDVTRAVVFVNCDEVAILDADDPTAILKIDTTVSLSLAEDAQVVVSAFGEQRLPDGLPNFDPTGVPRVLTNPIYVDADGDGVFGGAAGRECAYTLGLPEAQ